MSTNNGYENAPSTKMLATDCAICGRPLRDANSVETGIGPDCRKKYGYNIETTPEARAEANKLVHDIAVHQAGLSVLQAATRLRELGFKKLAEKVMDRCAEVVITEEAGNVFLKAPYEETAVAAIRNVPGRRWDAENKVNYFPARVEVKAALYKFLVAFYRGKTAIGPKGPFVIGAAA